MGGSVGTEPYSGYAAETETHAGEGCDGHNGRSRQLKSMAALLYYEGSPVEEESEDSPWRPNGGGQRSKHKSGGSSKRRKRRKLEKWRQQQQQNNIKQHQQQNSPQHNETIELDLNPTLSPPPNTLPLQDENAQPKLVSWPSTEGDCTSLTNKTSGGNGEVSSTTAARNESSDSDTKSNANETVPPSHYPVSETDFAAARLDAKTRTVREARSLDPCTDMQLFENTETLNKSTNNLESSDNAKSLENTNGNARVEDRRAADSRSSGESSACQSEAGRSLKKSPYPTPVSTTLKAMRHDPHSPSPSVPTNTGGKLLSEEDSADFYPTNFEHDQHTESQHTDTKFHSTLSHPPPYFHTASNNAVQPQSTCLQPQSTCLQPQSTCLQPQSTCLQPQSTCLQPQPSCLQAQCRPPPNSLGATATTVGMVQPMQPPTEMYTRPDADFYDSHMMQSQPPHMQAQHGQAQHVQAQHVGRMVGPGDEHAGVSMFGSQQRTPDPLSAFALLQQNAEIYPQRPAPRQSPTCAEDALQAAQEMLPMYTNAAAAPSRLPAHKPVRLQRPKHPLASKGTPVYFKYGEEHYPEETVPDVYTFTESDGTVCRYITNFLVYNKRGERLLPIEVLDQPRHGALVLYGSLLPASGIGVSQNERLPSPSSGEAKSDKKKARRLEEDCAPHAPYPIRIELAEWCIDYGQEPQNVPFVWLISRWDVYYRLEKPAGRYIPTFATAKMKFEVSTRVVKTLQWRPDVPYRELVNLLTAASRQQRQKKKHEEARKRQRRSNAGLEIDQHNDSGGNEDEDSDYPKKKGGRANWKIGSSLATPEGTGVRLKLPDGQTAPVTPWGSPYAVENVRESTLLGLADFLESQIRNFLEGVGGACPNLLETKFMHTLREKASIRRETLQLVEAKKRAIESMAGVNGFPHSSAPFDTPFVVAQQILQPLPVRQPLPHPQQVIQGCAVTSPLVTVGFAGDLTNPHHHRAMMMLKGRHQEEQELNRLLHLLKEFSDPEEDDIEYVCRGGSNAEAFAFNEDYGSDNEGDDDSCPNEN